MMTPVSDDIFGTTPWSRRLYWGACVGVMLLAAAIRVGGMLNDLWLDEIWSVQVAGSVSSFTQIFTGIHQDSNHYLNTCWLYFCGQRGNWCGYRIPAVVAGVGAVLMAGMIGHRRGGRCGALMALAVTGSSYVLVLYSSEARGYAFVVFFSLLSFYLLDLFLSQWKWCWAGGFSVSAILGFCAHPAFANFFLAAVAWSLYRLFQMRATFRQAAGGLVACYALPAAFVAWLYWVDLRLLGIAGGNLTGLLPGCWKALAWALGPPHGQAMLLLSGLAALTVMVAGVWLLWRRQPDLAVFLGMVTMVVPGALLLVLRPDMLYVRYFIVNLTFFLLLLSFVLSWLYERGPGGKMAALGLLGLFVVANALPTAQLMRLGRGQYGEAIRFMATHTERSDAIVGGDHDFRIPLVLQFYRSAAMPHSFQYLAQDVSLKQGVDWLVCHQESCDPLAPPARQLSDPEGNRYDLVRVYQAAPLSGLHWFIYQNQAKAKRQHDPLPP